MTDVLTLDQIDADGAVREAADRVGGNSRREFLKRGVIGGGAILGATALLPTIAEASGSGGDVAILQFALTLEYLESTFYVRAVDMHALSGETLRFAKTVRDHELAHVAALKATISKLGGKPIAKPKFDFKGIPSDPAKFRATAIALEDTGVSAYAGQVPNIKNKAVLAAAASIHSVEARHAAWMRDIVGESPAPVAFDPALTEKQVLKIVAATGFIV
jgi:hypothetical protein